MKVYKADNKKKFSVLAICLLLTVVFAVSGTLAYLFTSTDPVTNTFTPAKVGNFVDETFDGNTKTNVKIENSINGNSTDCADAYIRATVVVTWRNGSTVVPAAASDYTLTFANDGGWDLETNDGYYYYTGVVAPGEDTGVLITECKPNVTKDGYKLHVEILSQSIQAQPTTVVAQQWGVTVDGTTINK